MGAPDILQALEARGVRLQADGGHLVVTPKGSITDDERDQLRAAKAALLPYLARRQRAVAMLNSDPGLRRSAVFDPDVPSPDVFAAFALRDPLVAFEIRIPRNRYDAWLNPRGASGQHAVRFRRKVGGRAAKTGSEVVNLRTESISRLAKSNGRADGA